MEIARIPLTFFAKCDIMRCQKKMKAGGYTMQCDVVIVGAGPAGIFTALELIRGNTKENKRDRLLKTEAARRAKRKNA